MKYPKINKNTRREVNVPQLSGGLNLRDSLSGVRDNQMTDCINMWYKNGMLRTRPAFEINENMVKEFSIDCDCGCILDIKSHTDVKNEQAVLVSCVSCEGSYDSGEWNAALRFFWQYSDKTISAGRVDFNCLQNIVCKTREELETEVRKLSRLVFVKDGYIYLFLNNKNLDYKVYKAKLAVELNWEYVGSEDYYVPTVYAHCKRTGWDGFEGVQFEGYNLISDRYKMVYSAYNETDSDKTHPMRYKLDQKLPETGEITIDITSYNESDDDVITVSHKIVYDKAKYDLFSKGNILIEKFENGEEPQDGLYMFVKYNYVGFLYEPEFTYQEGIANIVTEEQISRYACNEDNVVITAPYIATEKERKKVFGMTQSGWFGGAANGINGGSRLFLCGNSNDEDKSLIVWSSLNNPLYFPENNYIYVGDRAQRVTAFGQQGENLIIFKEKSTYYTYYAANDSIDADDLIDQTVIDFEASSVCFPMVQLNSSVGCDCPNTVQLCRNRLVWANSDGNVYTLYSNNQYSERTIYKISDMIYSKLSKENDLKNAVSCDFEGHYLLGVGNKIYVMDYNSYGYQYASSFSKNEDSNLQIPWYIWTCRDEKGKFYEINNRLMRTSDFNTDKKVVLVFSCLDYSDKISCDIVALYDEASGKIVFKKSKIQSKAQTKLFDFLLAGYLKNIDKVSIAFGNNGGEEINVEFISNVGSNSETVSLISGDTNERNTSFVSVKNFYPTTKAVRIFGVKITCEGPICIEGLSIQYKLLGGVK